MFATRDGLAREKPYLHVRIGPFHSVHSATIEVKATTKGIVAVVVCVTPTVRLLTTFSEAVWRCAHSGLPINEAFALLLADVNGHLVVFCVVGLLHDVDLSLLRPVSGRGRCPERRPGAASLWLSRGSVVTSSPA